MAYKIQYDAPVINKYVVTKKKQWYKHGRLLIVLIAVLICISIVRKPVRSVLFPGDSDVTRDAAKKMLQSLQEGEGFYEAISAFCLEVIENGQQNSK